MMIFQRIWRPTCAKEMKYVATITQDIEERGLISVVDFQFGEMNIYYYLCIDCLIIKLKYKIYNKSNILC